MASHRRHVPGGRIRKLRRADEYYVDGALDLAAPQGDELGDDANVRVIDVSNVRQCSVILLLRSRQLHLISLRGVLLQSKERAARGAGPSGLTPRAFRVMDEFDDKSYEPHTQSFFAGVRELELSIRELFVSVYANKDACERFRSSTRSGGAKKRLYVERQAAILGEINRRIAGGERERPALVHRVPRAEMERVRRVVQEMERELQGQDQPAQPSRNQALADARDRALARGEEDAAARLDAQLDSRRAARRRARARRKVRKDDLKSRREPTSDKGE